MRKPNCLNRFTKYPNLECLIKWDRNAKTKKKQNHLSRLYPFFLPHNTGKYQCHQYLFLY